MKRPYLVGVIIGTVSLGLVLWFIHTGVYSDIELKFLDYRFNWRPLHSVNPDIVIAAIDDESINSIGRWPWPRTLHAAFLESFSKYPPRVIGFDILFTEPEKGEREGDTAMAHYSNLLGNIVYAGYIREDDNKIILPIEELTKTSSVGFINVPPDTDGIIRKVPLVIRHGEDLLPSFSLQVLCTYLNIDFKEIKINPGKSISIPSICDIPIDTDGNMWINYAGDQHVFREVAFHQAMGWAENDPEIRKFGNLLVLAGITATGIGDQGHIPIATNVPLITVHANILNTILNEDFLFKTPPRINLIISIIAIFLGLFINLLFRSTRAALLSLFLFVLFIAVNLWLFEKNIWVDILGPSLGFLTPFLLVTLYRYGWEERQRRWVKNVFGHYLSKDVIDVMLNEPKKLQLGGDVRTATVLYLDLRNFSSYCEGRSPEEVVNLLNQSFDWMTEIILKNGGMLDKYIGDAIMAIFGAPLETSIETQTNSAVQTALEIIDKWYKLHPEMRSNLDIGIGINTGPMLIGNMGSRYIFNYTAIGDEVNITARVQGLTAKYKVNIAITDSVYSCVKDKFKVEYLDEVIVKGRKGPVSIYKVSS